MLGRNKKGTATTWVEYASQSDAAKKLGLEQTMISRCVRGKAQTTKGYEFKHASSIRDGSSLNAGADTAVLEATAAAPAAAAAAASSSAASSAEHGKTRHITTPEAASDIRALKAHNKMLIDFIRSHGLEPPVFQPVSNEQRRMTIDAVTEEGKGPSKPRPRGRAPKGHVWDGHGWALEAATAIRGPTTDRIFTWDMALPVPSEPASFSLDFSIIKAVTDIGK